MTASALASSQEAAPASQPRRVLYITYDGLTDFLGQSQVLPYLLGCAAAGHRITVISFEKVERERSLGEQVGRQMAEAGIGWSPLRFRSSPPILSKVMDMRAMAAAATREAGSGEYDIVHCRSYPPALAGLRLKRRFGLPLLFDMRGFWPDSRREGGRWTSPIGSMLFRIWKRREAELVAGADHIITLTKAARDIVRSWPAYPGAPVSVISCCADFDLFHPLAREERLRVRAEIDVSPDALLVVYVGSLGTIYRLREQLRVFVAFRERYPGAKMLFVGRDDPAFIVAEARKAAVAVTEQDVRVIQAERSDVPRYIAASDVGLCFYTESFSSSHVSPTKMGEYLACGVPTLASSGLGDAAEILARTGGGHVLPDFSDTSIEAAVAWFADRQRSDGASIRARARRFLDLPQAVASYNAIYADLSRAVDAGY